MQGWNKLIAVEPPQTTAIERKVVGGIAAPVHRVALVPLKVVFGNTEIFNGSTVWVNAGLVNNQKWSTEVFEAKGKRFCLMPEANISLIEFPDFEWSAAECRMVPVNNDTVQDG